VQLAAGSLGEAWSACTAAAAAAVQAIVAAVVAWWAAVQCAMEQHWQAAKAPAVVTDQQQVAILAACQPRIVPMEELT
jgi:hypothetical protein